MKIQQINTYFKKFGEFEIKYRWLLLLFMALLIAVGISGLSRVKVESNNEDWFDKSDQIQIAEDAFEEQFGNNDTIGLLIDAEDVFHPEVLAMIRDIGNELQEKVPYADKITSLMDFELSIGTEDGVQIINPFEDGIPDDPQKMKELRDLILSRQAVVNKMVSDDGRETWLSLSLNAYPEKEEWEKTDSVEPLYQDGAAAMAVVTDPKWKSDRYTIKPAGTAYTEMEEKIFFGKEMKVRIMSGFGLMVVLLIVFLRSVRGVLVPVLTAGLGITVVFGIMGWLGIGVDANMVTLPILLGMALSVGYSIHLLNAFKRILLENGNRKHAAISAVEETGWPILFTAVTTIGSMLSFMAAGLLPIRWLGLTSAAVVFTVYLFVIILIPVTMSLGKDTPVQARAARKKLVVNLWLEKLGGFVLDHKRPITVLFALFVIVFAPGISRISVNMDMFDFVGLKVPYIHRVYEVANSKLGSYLSYNLTISYDEPGKIKDPQVMKNFETLLAEMGGFELTKKNKGVPKIFSVLDILKEMNQTFHGDNKAFYTIPENRDLIAQLLFLYEISGGNSTFDWIDEDYTMLRARVEVTKFNANEIVRELNYIKSRSLELFPDAKVETVGAAVRFAEINKKIVTGELKSFLTALVVIGILMGMVFYSVKTGLIGMVPNIVPLIILSGFMGYFKFPMDMMNMAIIPMLMGIAVDDTIHFINHIKLEFEKTNNYRTAILNSFYVIGKNLTMTTIILALTFAMYMFSPINNMFRIGLLASMGLVSALITDFTMTPILILLTKPFGKEKTACSEN